MVTEKNSTCPVLETTNQRSISSVEDFETIWVEIITEIFIFSFENY